MNILHTADIGAIHAIVGEPGTDEVPAARGIQQLIGANLDCATRTELNQASDRERVADAARFPFGIS